jgi:hypothetical protein
MRPEREVVVLFTREPCEVEDNNEVDLALVRPAVFEDGTGPVSILGLSAPLPTRACP